MLRKTVPVHLLLAPDAAAVGGGGAAVADPQLESDPTAMGSWMNAIGTLDDSAANPNAVAGSQGSAAVIQPGQAEKDAAAKRAAEDAAAATAAKAKADADAAKATQDAAAAAQAKTTEDEAKKKTDDGKEKYPRNQTDWDNFKAKRDEKFHAYEAQIKEHAAKVQAAEARARELEESLSKGVSPEDKAAIEQLKKERDELSERLAAADVQNHPRFQAYFKNLVDEQMAVSVEILGEDKAKEFQTIAELPNSPLKKAQMEEFLGDLPVMDQARMGAVMNSLSSIGRQREAEIRKAGEHKSTLTAQTQDKLKSAVAQREKVFGEVAKAIQDPDPAKGFPAYQLKPADAEGASEWNKSVGERVGIAKAFMTGQGITQERLVRACFDAAAMPTILEAYKADMAEKNGRITTLEAEINKLRAVQPKTQGAAADAGQQTTNEGGEIKLGMNPHEAAAAWTRKFDGTMRQ